MAATRIEDEVGLTLHQALEYDLMDELRALIEGGADLHGENPTSPGTLTYKPLPLAAFYGRTEAVEALLAAGAMATATTEERVAALVLSVYSWNDKVFRNILAAFLKEGGDVNLRNHGYSAISEAAQFSRLAPLQELVGNGANLDDLNYHGHTPLWNASAGGHLEAVQLLLQAGAAVDITAEGEPTPLMAAASNGHLAVVRLLLAAGADRDARVDGSAKAAELAAANGHVEVALEIRSHGSLSNKKRKALDRARRHIQRDADKKNGHHER